MFDGIKDREYDKFRPTNNNLSKVAVSVEQSNPVNLQNARFPKATLFSSIANQKNSHLFNVGCRQFLIRSEKITEIKYNFNETDYDNNSQLTITSGGFLKICDVYLENVSIYFKSDKDADIEILEWHD